MACIREGEDFFFSNCRWGNYHREGGINPAPPESWARHKVSEDHRKTRVSVDLKFSWRPTKVSAPFQESLIIKFFCFLSLILRWAQLYAIPFKNTQSLIMSFQSIFACTVCRIKLRLNVHLKWCLTLLFVRRRTLFREDKWIAHNIQKTRTGDPSVLLLIRVCVCFFIIPQMFNVLRLIKAAQNRRNFSF